MKKICTTFKWMALAMGLSLYSHATYGANPILVEAESCTNKGGGVVDQQFTHTVGSSYLLAHGMGQPVADASAMVDIPASGNYRIWVRTKNWVPGAWKAPGRFNVKVDGKQLAGEFGTQEGWGWQDGGTIDLKSGSRKISLVDLTGFEGRSGRHASAQEYCHRDSHSRWSRYVAAVR
jgi:hypothetical protein